MASSTNLLKRILLAITVFLLTPTIALAQLPGRGARITGTLSKALDQFYWFFKNDYTILFILYFGGWAFVYLVYRLGLEQSGRIPPQFCSKLAIILSLITITPMLYALQRYPTVRAAVRDFMTGWLGLTVTFILGLIIYGFSYFMIRHYLSETIGGGP